MKKWFEIDPAGLAMILERRGRGWIVGELVANGFDAGATSVQVHAEPVAGRPLVKLTVTDDSPEGWADLSDAYTIFAKSRRGGDAEKRGRFGLGEKMVIAACESARIETMTGTVSFDDTGRHNDGRKRTLGTQFVGMVRMTRDELADLETAAMRMIPPAGVRLTFNDSEVTRPEVLATFAAKLPTVAAGEDGALRHSSRVATVEAFASDGAGEALELGVPVAVLDCPWRLNVLQKIPLGMERDTLTDGFRKSLTVAALNALGHTVTPEQAAEPWASEAVSDGRVKPEAVAAIVRGRFGDRAVSATVGDPLANAQAEAMGYTVVHGGALPAGAWANVRKAGVMVPAGQVFPSPRPDAMADSAAGRMAAEGRSRLALAIVAALAEWWREGSAPLQPGTLIAGTDRPLRALVMEAAGG